MVRDQVLRPCSVHWNDDLNDPLGTWWRCSQEDATSAVGILLWQSLVDMDRFTVCHHSSELIRSSA